MEAKEIMETKEKEETDMEDKMRLWEDSQRGPMEANVNVDAKGTYTKEVQDRGPKTV